MKRVALIKLLSQLAADRGVSFDFVREGKAHEVWSFAGLRLPIPRHREINERTARGIIEAASAAAEEQMNRTED